jgi:hypothetical protein
MTPRRASQITLPAVVLAWMCGISACGDNAPTRQLLNDAVRATVIAPNINAMVQGGSIVSVTESDTPTKAAAFVVRAQSLDLRIDLKSQVCLKTWVHMTATHLAQDRLLTSAQAFFDELSPYHQTAGSVDPSGAGFKNDIHNPNWTALNESRDFVPERAMTAPNTLKWTTCISPSTRFVRIVQGHVGKDLCGFPNTNEENGTCAEASDNQSQDLGNGEFIVRHRISTPVSGMFRFAVWGNNRADNTVRGKLIKAVNDSDALFVIISGDMTANGSTKALRSATEVLDSRLDIPWYATLGDRDVQGNAGKEYPTLIGASTFAFDAGDVRLVVVDSADRSIGLSTREAMGSWLGGAALGWQTPAPPAALVVTHVPPFDVYGTRGNGLKQRFEGASVVALLSRAKVPYLLTSQLSEFQIEDTGDTQIIHAGGGGAPIPEGVDGGHYWLMVTIDPSCATGEHVTCGGATRDRPCPCIKIQQNLLE